MSNKELTINEAYDIVWERLKFFTQQGIKVVAKPSCSRNTESILDKYGNVSGRISPEKWVHVCLSPATKDQRDLIYEEAGKLGKLGIAFDTGSACDGTRDWEIDWSLHLATDVEDMEAGRATVEELLHTTPESLH